MSTLAGHTSRATLVSVKLQWSPSHWITVAEGVEKLTFPVQHIPQEGGVYRIVLQSEQGVQRVYIGEAGNLLGRARGYALGRSDPGTTEKVHDAIGEALRDGWTATYQHANPPEIRVGSARFLADLLNPFERKLVENAARVQAWHRRPEAVINARTGEEKSKGAPGRPSRVRNR